MNREQLRQGIVRLCQDYGTVSEDTYELIDAAVDSIADTVTDRSDDAEHNHGSAT